MQFTVFCRKGSGGFHLGHLQATTCGVGVAASVALHQVRRDAFGMQAATEATSVGLGIFAGGIRRTPGTDAALKY